MIDREYVLKELDRVKKLTESEQVGMQKAKEIVANAPDVDAIPIEWMRKEMVEMLFNDELGSETMKIFNLLVSRWKRCV